MKPFFRLTFLPNESEIKAVEPNESQKSETKTFPQKEETKFISKIKNKKN
ncbi:Hypothetical protein LEPBI_I2478 [Leptospira biflexa serovar Patoc strain 'Patoc 1 (Paris)']|uniref:Uncharacterized protein n=1 Tax=Leptospira biflexa serovar Patoc (strain Patoc 1 / ATCC 23582 / Paris) TaxID=456481 RepID=B0SLI0_LEPBP|nr:Hypothetical protein LEPBI_I2478 [Leptospira biflexa serovar Patoc strain 'Patoc 1 (Paris)']